MEENTEITDNSTETAGRNGEHLRPYQWKKGQSGNPGGRPKDTLKQYLAKKLREMSEEEKEQFLRDVPKDLQWRMSEGNPATETEHKGELKVQILPSEVIEKNEIQISPEPIPDSEGQEPV